MLHSKFVVASLIKTAMVTVLITSCLLYTGCGKTDEVSILIRKLKSNDPNARVVAADTLGEIKDASAAGPLIAALKDENPDVRESAADALGEIGDTRAVEPLIAALKDRNPDVRESAADALMVITDEEFEEDPAKWQEWWEKNKKKIHK